VHHVLNVKIAEIDIKNCQLDKSRADIAHMVAELNSANAALSNANDELQTAHDTKIKLLANLEQTRETNEKLEKKASFLDITTAELGRTQRELSAIKNRPWWEPFAPFRRPSIR
jgi:hypothetical protein